MPESVVWGKVSFGAFGVVYQQCIVERVNDQRGSGCILLFCKMSA